MESPCHETAPEFLCVTAAACRIEKDGAVVAVRCYNKDTDSFQTLNAGAVILATGGFGKLFPEFTNSNDIGGDGCAMAAFAKKYGG